MSSISTINVPFHGNNLYVVSNNGVPYVPMKPIVEGMGLTWQSQFEKLKQRFSKGITEIVIPSKGGEQLMVCLALRKLAGWLHTISPNKVKPEIRDKVIQYQDECDDVLYEYWTTGEVKKKETNPTVFDGLFPENGRILITFKDNRIYSADVVSENEHLLSLDSFFEIAKKSGYLVINKDKLLSLIND